MKIAVFGLVMIIAVIALTSFVTLRQKQIPTIQVNTFEECQAAGYPILESYPERCNTPDGRSFVREIGNELEYSDVITVSNPRPNQAITSPITVTGSARGTWYFEANFPIELQDENGKVLGTAIGVAIGEWMTEEFVPFEVQLEFSTPTTKKGKLIIKNANPSGLDENQEQLEMPVVFE